MNIKGCGRAAPKLLTREDVEKLGNRVDQEFLAGCNNLSGGVMRWTLDYAPFLLAGLLRWRLKEPKALIVGIDPLADKLLSAFEYTKENC